MVWTKNATPEVDAESRYPAIIAVNVVFTFLMLAAVTTRIVTRKSSLGADGYIIVVTAVFSVVYNCFSIIETHWGLGLPIALRPHANTHTFKILSYAGKPWYQFGICGFKLALCISYLRFLRGLNGKEHHVYRWTIISVAVFSTLFHAIATMINFFFCMPLAKNFDASVPGHCLDFLALNYSIAAITIFCDVMVFTLPTQIFRHLQMDRKVKIEICAMFLLGLLTTVCSISRATYFRQVENGNGDSTMVVLFGTVEFNVGLIACCLPFMRGIILRSWSSTISSSKKASNAYALDNYRSIHSSKIEKSKAGSSDSQENIIEQGKDGGILRTVSYHVNEVAPNDEV